MNTYEVSFQLVDSPRDCPKPDGAVDESGLIPRFRQFPWASEVKRGDTMDGDVTFPTLIFKRAGDGEEVALWTMDAKHFDLRVTHGTKRKQLKQFTAQQVEGLLTKYQTETVCDFRTPTRAHKERPQEVLQPGPPVVVFVDKQMRWLFVLFFVITAGGAYAIIRYVPAGASKYIVAVPVGLFSLFWAKGALVGVRMRIISDGRILSWEEGGKHDAFEMARIAKVTVQIYQRHGKNGVSVVWIQFEMSDGDVKEMPPNLAEYAWFKNANVLRQMLAHIRTITPVTVEGFDENAEAPALK